MLMQNTAAKGPINLSLNAAWRRGSSVKMGVHKHTASGRRLPSCLKKRSNDETESILPYEDGLVRIQRGLWDIEYFHGQCIVTGCVRVTSLRPHQELFIPKVQCKAEVVTRQSCSCFKRPMPGTARIGQARLTAMGVQVCPEDFLDKHWSFWSVPILKKREAIHIPVRLILEDDTMSYMTDLWLQFELDVYGPHGLEQQQQHIVLPFSCPPVPALEDLTWSDCPHMPGAQALPIATHLLCHLDDPAAVVEKYAAAAARVQGGSVVCISESALAIMQGRWRHYSDIRPGLLARLGCRLFSPVSSMASACGLQAAVYLVGRLRVAVALVLGSLTRLFGICGVFYRIVGKAATAIDDLTGTLAPYDRFIVFGPKNPRQAVLDVEEQTGLKAAVVDVNDLSRSTGGVSILSHSSSINIEDLKRAILHNPAGNGDQQTPLLIVRGLPCEEEQY